jgi:hypothetical protein
LITVNLRRTRDNVIEKNPAKDMVAMYEVQALRKYCVGFYQSDVGVLAEICHGEGTTSTMGCETFYCKVSHLLL